MRYGGRQKKTRQHKMYGRGTDEQKALLEGIIKQSGGRADQVDIMSAALDLYCAFVKLYPLGLDLLPQIPELRQMAAGLDGEAKRLKKKSRIA
jgi:hypothetical protein